MDRITLACWGSLLAGQAKVVSLGPRIKSSNMCVNHLLWLILLKEYHSSGLCTGTIKIFLGGGNSHSIFARFTKPTFVLLIQPYNADYAPALSQKIRSLSFLSDTSAVIWGTGQSLHSWHSHYRVCFHRKVSLSPTHASATFPSSSYKEKRDHATNTLVWFVKNYTLYEKMGTDFMRV